MRKLSVLLAAAVMMWAVWESMGDLGRLERGFPFLVRYLASMWPPELAVLPRLWGPLVESVKMAVGGMVFAVLIAMPISFIAARNTTPCFVAYLVSRSVIAVLRAIPAMLLALLFVSLAGLGSLPGILALSFHGVGVLGKNFSEVIESIGPTTVEVLEAMRVDGASEWRALVHGLIPAVLPFFVSYTLSRLESNIRTSTILGLVGAGGLGIPLNESIQLFRRQETATIVLLIIGLALAVDVFSRAARKRLLD